MRAARVLLLLGSLLFYSVACPASPPSVVGAPPKIRALLEQAWAAESGAGQVRNLATAATLYCEAARHGSPEAHFRSALLHIQSTEHLRNPEFAKFFLHAALELGHEDATRYLPDMHRTPMREPPCLTGDFAYLKSPGFDFSYYVDNLSSDKHRVAQMLKRLAPEYGVDIRLALAIAGVESNFAVMAQSPKNAQGVMQLIPATSARFGVRNAFDPEQNIRGGLAYLKWLLNRYSGDPTRVVAAYNAGEGAVDRYKGVPPYTETQNYVRRVLTYSQLK